MFLGALEPLDGHEHPDPQQGRESRALEAAIEERPRNLPENRERHRRAVGTEEDPRETDEVERDEGRYQTAQQVGNVPVTAVPGVRLFDPLSIDQKVEAVQEPPDYEGPVSTVPESADHEHNERVQGRAPRAKPVTTQRNIEVGAEPGGERDMPAAPEILDVRGKVRIGEVPGHVQCEQPGASDSDIRVATEVAINLEGEPVGRPQQLPSGRVGHVAIGPGHVEPQSVRDHHLLKEPPQHLPQPVDGVVPVKVPLLFELD